MFMYVVEDHSRISAMVDHLM